MTKKNVWLSPLLTTTLIASAGLSPEVMAQFDKYKSKTKFNKLSSPKAPPSSANPLPQENITIPDTGKSAKSLLQDTTNFVPGDEDNADEESGVAASDGESDSEEGTAAIHLEEQVQNQRNQVRLIKNT